MKKILFVVSVLALSLVVTGCSWQKKPTTPDTTASTADQTQTTGAVDSTAATPGTSTQTEPSSGAAATGSTAAAAAAKVYDDNLQKASQNAVATIADNSFCNVIIEYPAKGTYSSATESFFFTSANASLKDWYWVVQFDQVEGAKRELFAARRGFKDLTCAKPKQALKIGFAEAMDKAQANGALTALDSQNASRVKITLFQDTTDDFWQVTILSDDSQVLGNIKINASNGYIDTQPAASASATAGTF